MFKFECPQCQQHISADPSQSGLAAQCPTCGGDFVVPDAPEGTEPIDPPIKVVDENPLPGTQESPGSDATSPTQNSGPKHSFGERLKDGSVAMKKGAQIVKEGSMVGWSGLKRKSKQAALRAQIEKLRQIDLRRAFHALGTRAFEQDVLADTLSGNYQTIRELDAKITELRERSEAESGETKIAALKRMGKDTAKAGQAQALTVKREHSITELGRAVHTHKNQINAQGLNEEIAVIINIERHTQEIEEQIRALDDGGKSGIQTLAVAAMIGLLIVAGALFGFNRLPGDGTPSTSDQKESAADWRNDPPYKYKTTDNYNSKTGGSKISKKATDLYSKSEDIYPSIRGLKLGMSEGDVKNLLIEMVASDLEFIPDDKQHKNNVKSYYFGSMSLAKNIPDRFAYQAKKNYMDIDTNSKTLVGIAFCGPTFTRFFDAEDIMLDEFCQQFMQRYGIKRLEPWQSNYVKSYQYNTGDYKFRFSLDSLGDKGFAMDIVRKASF